jgi:hypothetical protein
MKKGAVEIINVMLILAISIAAISILWGFIMGVIEERADTARITSSCLDSVVEIVFTDYNETEKSLVVGVGNVGSRTAEGVRVIFGKNKNDSLQNLKSLEWKGVTFSNITTIPEEVTAAQYYLDSNDEPFLCDNSHTMEVVVN